MESEEEADLAAIVIATSTENIRREKRRKRKEWVNTWVQRQNSREFYSQLRRELRLEEKDFAILLRQI